MKIVFWFSLLFVIYTYAGYPLFIKILSYFGARDTKKDTIYPTVSVVISALNEEKTIQARIDNLLTQDYPTDRLEIIIVSDGCADKTDEIVRSYNQKNLKLFSTRSRKGKASALNYGISEANGEIVVFADARQIFAPDAIKHLVWNFNDPSVGCVSGELIFLEDGGSNIQAEIGAYWYYEKWIRKTESKAGSTIGATGAIYAIRRALYKPLPAEALLDDVLTPMNIVMQGYRTIFDGSAIAYDSVSKDMTQEWRRKVRTLAGNWQLLSLSPALLVPWKNSVWWRFSSHKIFRVIVPFALFCLLISAAMLAGDFYRTCAMGQLLFYVAALSGALMPGLRRFRLINTIYFFVTMNFAGLMGFWRWITGRCETSWQPAYKNLTEKV